MFMYKGGYYDTRVIHGAVRLMVFNPKTRSYARVAIGAISSLDGSGEVKWTDFYADNVEQDLLHTAASKLKEMLKPFE